MVQALRIARDFCSFLEEVQPTSMRRIMDGLPGRKCKELVSAEFFNIVRKLVVAVMSNWIDDPEARSMSITGDK